ncbi:hypothetical protein [Alishewanella tabrizica]|uniref:DUF4852 domain-containing protein n=1 Tax=Alishewanella tabrizica TaxID=671278 RepID=A0ABQ2WBH5_9ALTE|nr:hypothetical protein [Alishewanella tabrizica]GGW48549.1 hypothetical protein GCM10008111_00240 [Alishewanella tabrizica]
MQKTALTLITSASLLLLTLTGCSDKPAEQSNTPAAEVPQEQAAAVTSEAPTVAKLSVGDAAKPLAEYAEWQGNNHVMFTYYALSKIPVDYDKVLENYSQEYRDSNDNFRKNDLKNALKEQIDAEIAAAANVKYLKTSWNYFILEAYDFTSLSFPQSKLTNNSIFYWQENHRYHPYQISFTNGDDFKNLVVKDEATARRIEELRSKFQQLNLNLYTFVQATDPAQNAVKVQVVAVELVDGQGNVLLTQYSK